MGTCTDREILSDLQPQTTEQVAVFENERLLPLRGWSASNLLPTDRKRYSGPSGRNGSDFPVITLEPGQACISQCSGSAGYIHQWLQKRNVETQHSALVGAWDHGIVAFLWDRVGMGGRLGGGDARQCGQGRLVLRHELPSAAVPVTNGNVI